MIDKMLQPADSKRFHKYPPTVVKTGAKATVIMIKMNDELKINYEFFF